MACLLSLDRLLALDWEDGSLDLLATAPLPLEGIVSIKALAHWITTGLPLVLAAPVLGVLLNLPGPGFGWLVVSLLIGTPALSVIGTFGAALTVGLKRGGLLNVVRYEVEVVCRADAIPQEFKIDLAVLDLDIGDSVHASNLTLPPGVQLTITDRDFTIATIVICACTVGK